MPNSLKLLDHYMLSNALQNTRQLAVNRKIFLEAKFSHSKLLHKRFVLLLRDIIA